MKNGTSPKKTLEEILDSLEEPTIPEGLSQRIVAKAVAQPQEERAGSVGASANSPSIPAWGWRITAIAASLAAAFFLYIQLALSSLTDVQTVPGEQRVIVMEDGSSITVKGDSHLQLDEDRNRFAILIDGEAYFSIVHDDNAPFVVETPTNRLIDKGTEFNVKASEDELEVSVAEGLVQVELANENQLLKPGQTLERSKNGQVQLRAVEPSMIGKWMTGQLVFELASLADVAEEVTRATGTRIKLDPTLQNREFSGVITVSDNEEELARTLGVMLEVHISRGSEGGWIIEPIS